MQRGFDLTYKRISNITKLRKSALTDKNNNKIILSEIMLRIYIYERLKAHIGRYTVG